MAIATQERVEEKVITAQISPPLATSPTCDFTVAEAVSRAKQIADFAENNAPKWDKTGEFPVEEFEKIAAAGLLKIPLSRELGGLGLGFATGNTYEMLLLLKEIGRGNLAVGRVYEGHVNALQLIQTFATQEQITRFAADARSRQKIFGVWNAEATDGVKLIPIANNRYRLEGSKTFASGCGYVDRPFVNGALPDGGWQMCIVPMDEVETIIDPDWWQPPGMRATVSYKVDYTGVEVDSRWLIGKPGDYFRQPWLTAGVVRFAAVHLGGAEALFNATRQYLQALQRTDHPYQQERLGKMAIAIESGNLWLRGAAEIIDNFAPIFGGYPEDNDPQKVAQLVAYTNMVRTAIEQICLDTIQLSERSIGTLGLLPPHPMERIIRDLTLYLRQPAYDAAVAAPGKYVLDSTTPANQVWDL
ncbi:MAG: acyl-CoA dehydrogenase family protein [Oscillatoria sp. PMC 1068.18]|nr:acyl-CoA dehydrogenase family protein [Oscillatoria sp. PMC 1076.18]MEC4989714.1 acyl-CoA dehydrogenase family protein [Oscillatoria sp. PMC 1068.18]